MMKHDYGEIFEWGLKDGKVIHIDNVENGLACNCFCPDCEAPLVAFNRQGNKRVNHFQHKNKSNCTNSYETALHYLAKQIILETKSLTVPDIYFSLSSYAQSFYGVTHTSERKINKQILKFDKVEVERSEQNFRPDLKCYINEKILLIEIAVTHFVDPDKREKILNKNIPLLEIDLSEFERAIQKDKLIEIFRGKIDKMKWVYNPKIKERHQFAESKGAIVKNYISKNLDSHKIYGKDHNIYDCPIYKNIYDKIKVEDECYRCRYFVGEYQGVYEIGDEQPKFPDTTLECVGHKANEFDKLLKSVGIKIKE